MSTKLGHIFSYDCYLKNLIWIPRSVYPHGLRAKTAFFGTDFKLWQKISLQQNMITTIGKKLVNLQWLPYMPPIFVNVGPQMAECSWRDFAQHPNFLQFVHKTSCMLTFVTHFSLIIFTRWRQWLTQMPRAWLALVRLRAKRAHAGLCHASSSYCVKLQMLLQKLLPLSWYFQH